MGLFPNKGGAREMKKLAVLVIMASISLTACSNKAVKADSIEVMKNIEETTSIEEVSTIEETSSIEETTSIEETSTIEEATSIEETSTIEEISTIEKTKETDESNGVNSVGEDTILGEEDYKETDIEADMILSEDLQKIYDSFSEEDKALYRELMKDVDTSDTTPPSTGTTPPSTGTVPSTGTGGYGQLMPEEDLDPDWQYRFENGDYSDASPNAVVY